ncbi:unnamed protein product [Phytomonas sp. Hart1]|nr:unnamed protein product [Phytomonas sp. Hart1]|eukprot:CCW71512.1 unnamed protein product [Phytomonas sp. isolate Hart1]
MEDKPYCAENGNSTSGVEGKYLIHEEAIVGRGAWSVVKRCTPIPPYTPRGSYPGMKFVVKVIEKEYLISLTKGDVDRAMVEVKREINVLRHIPPHENVVTFIEHIETEKHFLLFFEEVCCGDLCELILQTPDGKLTEGKAKLYIYQIIKAVIHCHLHDVIHRDIKPENLLVSEKDDIKLTDFGLAKYSKGVCTGDAPSDPLDLVSLMMPYIGCERFIGKRVVCSDVIGTPRYGAPEMFYAKFTQTHYDGFSADTWSIGVVAYIMLSGSFPYSASSSASEEEVFRTIMDTPLPSPTNISSSALDFIQCLLNKDPTKRVPLYKTLNHPWLMDIVVPRGSIVASKLRQNSIIPKVEEACKWFDEEAMNLHICISKLEHELLVLRSEFDKSREEHKFREVPKTPPRRAQTPIGTSRLRNTRSPVSSSKVTSASRPGSRLRTVSRDVGTTLIQSKPLNATSRTRSPLARSACGAAVRRGTPARTGGTTPASLRSGTPTRPTTRSTSTIRGSHANRAMTPSGKARESTLNHTPRKPSQTPRTLSGGMNSMSSSTIGATQACDLRINDHITYKGHRAVVRFNGPTSFGAGIWIGLEMLEGNEGTNDGSSFIDKKEYFKCPKGRGVFVRASQVKRC